MRNRASISLLTALVLCSPSPASSFQVASPIHRDCHERLLFAALEQITITLPGFPAAVTHEDRVLADALQFDVSPYGKDRYTTSLMIGVRYNDLHGKQATEVGELAPVHNDESYQDEHCLRRSSHDGPAGAAQAVEECRRFIQERVNEAFGDADRPDPLATDEVELFLRFRGSGTVEVSRLYFQLGWAVHAIQDSFSHTLRKRVNEGGSNIVEVANWVDEQAGNFVEGRDGIQHLSVLDDCSCSSPAYDALLEDVTQAGAEFLEAVLGATTGADRQTRLDAFFAKWMSFEAGCTMDNAYCDHALMAEVKSDALVCAGPVGCQMAAGRGEGDASLASTRLWPLLALLLLLPLWRRRKALLVTTLLMLASATASATPSVHCPVPEASPGLYTIVRAGVSADMPSLAFEGSALYRGERFGGGLAIEFNPFLSVDRGFEARAGTLNISALGSIHLQLTNRISLRFELRAGLAVLLFDTPGYETGDVGLNIGMRALGFDIRLGKHLFLMLDPIDLSMPIFSLDKLPFYYRQWRIGAGVAWRF